MNLGETDRKSGKRKLKSRGVRNSMARTGTLVIASRVSRALINLRAHHIHHRCQLRSQLRTSQDASALTVCPTHGRPTGLPSQYLLEQEIRTAI
jgi:hypothetical protein